MDKRGFPYCSNRGMASGVAAAYRRAVKEVSQDLADCISNVFIDKEDGYAYENY